MSEVEEAAVKGAIDAAMEDVLEMQIEEEQEEAEAAAEEAAGDGGATDADADGSSGPPSETALEAARKAAVQALRRGAEADEILEVATAAAQSAGSDAGEPAPGAPGAADVAGAPSSEPSEARHGSDGAKRASNAVDAFFSPSYVARDVSRCVATAMCSADDDEDERVHDTSAAIQGRGIGRLEASIMQIGATVGEVVASASAAFYAASVYPPLTPLAVAAAALAAAKMRCGAPTAPAKVVASCGRAAASSVGEGASLEEVLETAAAMVEVRGLA